MLLHLTVIIVFVSWLRCVSSAHAHAFDCSHSFSSFLPGQYFCSDKSHLLFVNASWQSLSGPIPSLPYERWLTVSAIDMSHNDLQGNPCGVMVFV